MTIICKLEPFSDLQEAFQYELEHSIFPFFPQAIFPEKTNILNENRCNFKEYWNQLDTEKQVNVAQRIIKRVEVDEATVNIQLSKYSSISSKEMARWQHNF